MLPADRSDWFHYLTGGQSWVMNRKQSSLQSLFSAGSLLHSPYPHCSISWGYDRISAPSISTFAYRIIYYECVILTGRSREKDRGTGRGFFACSKKKLFFQPCSWIWSGMRRIGGGEGVKPTRSSSPNERHGEAWKTTASQSRSSSAGSAKQGPRSLAPEPMSGRPNGTHSQRSAWQGCLAPEQHSSPSSSPTARKLTDAMGTVCVPVSLGILRQRTSATGLIKLDAVCQSAPYATPASGRGCLFVCIGFLSPNYLRKNAPDSSDLGQDKPRPSLMGNAWIGLKSALVLKSLQSAGFPAIGYRYLGSGGGCPPITTGGRQRWFTSNQIDIRRIKNRRTMGSLKPCSLVRWWSFLFSCWVSSSWCSQVVRQFRVQWCKKLAWMVREIQAVYRSQEQLSQGSNSKMS